MLTKTDLKNIQLIVRQQVKEEVADQLDEKIGKLPTKGEYFETMDKLMVELKGAREDLAAHKVRHETIGEDTTGLKKNVNNLYKVFELDQPVVQPAI